MLADVHKEKRVRSAVVCLRKTIFTKSNKTKDPLKIAFNRYIDKNLPLSKKFREFFSGLEIRNINLQIPKQKVKKTGLENQMTIEDQFYEPLEYQKYLQSNYNNIVIDESYRVSSKSPAIQRTGKLRTGSVCRGNKRKESFHDFYHAHNNSWNSKNYLIKSTNSGKSFVDDFEPYGSQNL